LPLLVPFGLLPSFRGADWSALKLLKTSAIIKHWKPIFFHSRKNIFGYGNRKQFVINLLKMYHIPTRMDTWAFYSEKFGFEYKYPLLDKDVLEYWFSLPVSFTYEKLVSRGLYREMMKGILTETIRTRNDKSENLRMAYSFQKMKEGKEYLEQQFDAIPVDVHLPFFKTDEYRKLFESQVPEKRPHSGIFIGKLCLYLRHVELVKKYIAK
jgi:hypothetical protein